jgi:tocopherol O-methyltransferase
MITCATVRKETIRGHYNLTTPFYRLLWGKHIHHGLWDASESPKVAQQRLTETLAREAGIRGGEMVLDVGCGMGGSAHLLAKQYGCHVTGVTLSRLQCLWARCTSLWHCVSDRTDFLCDDAERIELPPRFFDCVWSIECTEHLFDKPAFFQRAANWLRPGGTTAICAWLAGERLESPEMIRQVHDVCEGFFCPSLGTMDDYCGWMEEAGLTVVGRSDWTPRVVKTWEICRRRVRKTGMHWLARVIDKDTHLFVDRFDAILRAYRSGAMQYGCIIGRRPE